LKIGTVAGGVVSTIQNTYCVARGQINYNGAVANVAKDTFGAGIASVAGTVAMTVLGAGGILGLVGFPGVAAVSNGIWDLIVYGRNRAVKHHA
jgi:hypothetical protein